VSRYRRVICRGIAVAGNGAAGKRLRATRSGSQFIRRDHDAPAMDEKNPHMIYTPAEQLKVLIATVLERHHRVSAAIGELTRAIDEARVRDRVADLRQQLEQGDDS
jgi:hypothetical protein